MYVEDSQHMILAVLAAAFMLPCGGLDLGARRSIILQR